jgi:hypothetical protein
MNRFPLVSVGLLVFLAVLGIPLGGTGVAAQQPDYTDHLAGIEISPGLIIKGVRVGTAFLGSATGGLPGTWTVSFCYAPPHPGLGVTNVIQGGTWSLAVRRSGSVVGRLFGTIKTGAATWNDSPEEPEEAAVWADMNILGGSGEFRGARGTASFLGTLSHEYLIPRLTGDMDFFVED